MSPARNEPPGDARVATGATRAGRASPNPTNARNRSHIKEDRFALFDLGRQYRLSAHERLMLEVLVKRADFRSQEWNGSITELASDMNAGRKTVSRVLIRLEAIGLIETVRPFIQGGQGSVRVVAYEDLVVPERNARVIQIASNDAIDLPVVAPWSRPDRVAHASRDANPPMLISANADLRGREAAREGGSSTEESNAIGEPERELVATDLCVCCDVPAVTISRDGKLYCREHAPF